ASFQGQDGKVFDKVYMRKLVSGDTTRAGEVQTNGDVIKQAFADLKEKYNYTIYDRDFLILFISSHGRSVNNSFKIVPTDFEMVGEKALIDFQDDVIEQIDRIACNKLIFIDACQSGSIAQNDSLPPGQEALSAEELEKEKVKEQERLRAQAKAIVEQGKAAAATSTLASCNANESSWEDKIWGNGAFTEAIIAAFKNEPYQDANGAFKPTSDDNILTLGELVEYIRRRVPQMILDAGKQGTQHPFIAPEQLEQVKNIALVRVSK
ncbi:MAG: caspase family protein, partial [Bacteroidetes bacterium]